MDSDTGWLKTRWRVVNEDHRHAAEQGDPLPVRKTYRYLRIGMLTVVAALGYSIVHEHRASGCWLGSISGYYYTPAGPVFVGMLVAIALALVVIKGRMWEDVLLTLAGFMAPVVAFLPTRDPTLGSTSPPFTGACLDRTWELGRYRPDAGKGFLALSAKNDLHALAFAGAVGIGMATAAYLFAEWWRRRSGTDTASELTSGTRISLALSVAFAVAGYVVVNYRYDWLLDKHALAAAAMFGCLALAAGLDGLIGVRATAKMQRRCGLAYLATGLAMLVAGGFFWFSGHDPNGHSVIWIEGIEITLFAIFWLIQTIERWNPTAGPTT